MPYYFTEREGQRGGGFEMPPPPQQQQPPQQQREPAPEIERRSDRSEVAAAPPPPRPQPAVRPPVSRQASSPPPRPRGVPQDNGRPQHYRVENLPPRYNGPRSEPPPRYEGSRYDGPRYESSRSEPQRYQGPRYETSRSEPPMRYDGTDRWPPSSSYSRVESLPSDDVQRYSHRTDERGRIIVNPSRDPYDVSPHQQYSGPAYTTSPRGGTAAGPGVGPGQMVISVEEYRALQSQARELQRLLGERNGGTRISRPGPAPAGPYNSYPRTIYR